MSDTERILQKWPIKLLTVRNQSHRVGNPLEDIEEIDTVVENQFESLILQFSLKKLTSFKFQNYILNRQDQIGKPESAMLD